MGMCMVGHLYALNRLFVRILVLMFSVVLAVQNVSADESESLHKYIEQNTDRLVEKLNVERVNFEKDPERFYLEMDGALESVVDFRRIAAKVMGKYVRRSTKEQREQFLSVFKRSLYVAYSKALVESGSFEIEVTGVQINPRSDERATANLEIVSEKGNRYPVAYSLFKDNEGIWKIENVIVQGVNIGLVFRDRFEQEVRSYKGDLDQVIAGWSSNIDQDQLLGDKSGKADSEVN